MNERFQMKGLERLIHSSLYFALVLLVSCNMPEEKGSSGDKISVNEDTVSSDSKEPFDINLYKQKVDSINELIVRGVPSKFSVDTLQNIYKVFAEISEASLPAFPQQEKVIRYNFSFSGENNILKHHLVIVTFESKNLCDSSYSLLAAISLSGAPGLTYSNDYVIGLGNNIYWLNSSCAYAYSNHLKFVDSFKKLINFRGSEIRCKCGAVKCEVITPAGG